jgi:hypothetical protein
MHWAQSRHRLSKRPDRVSTPERRRGAINHQVERQISSNSVIRLIVKQPFDDARYTLAEQARDTPTAPIRHTHPICAISVTVASEHKADIRIAREAFNQSR